VRWLEWIEPAELARLVHRHDVCLGIFGSGEKGLRVTPNKVFQGAAAACAIVTSDTAPQRRALGDSARFVPPGDPAALARELVRLAAAPDEVAALRHAAYRRAEECFRGSVLVAPLREVLRSRVAD
jgi:glycosyltransferase involved in cell wall biosynthesis